MSRYDRPSHRVYMTFFLRKGWRLIKDGAAQDVQGSNRSPAQPSFLTLGAVWTLGTVWIAGMITDDY